MIHALDLRHARRDAGGEHDLVELPGQLGGRDAGCSASVHPGLLDAAPEVAQRLGELFLLPGICMAMLNCPPMRAPASNSIDLVAALGGGGGEGQARRAGADHRDFCAGPWSARSPARSRGRRAGSPGRR